VTPNGGITRRRIGLSSMRLTTTASASPRAASRPRSSRPVQHGAYRSLDGGRIIASQAVQKAAGNQRIDVGVTDFDRETSKTPARGTTHWAAPSSSRCMRSSAIRTDVLTALEVSISTTARLTLLAIEQSRRTAARWQCPSPPRQSPFRLGLNALQQDFRFARAEFACPLVPKQREGAVAVNTQLSPLQEGRIVGIPEPQRRLPITSLGGALVKKASGRNIARAEKDITTIQQHRSFSAGLFIGAGDHSSTSSS
jgi:hypothetical protein